MKLRGDHCVNSSVEIGCLYCPVQSDVIEFPALILRKTLFEPISQKKKKVWKKPIVKKMQIH